ncbi:protein kinase domain-containing protein [Nakamurella sp.]|uniref:serine/threonine-protein kinase n=1 Tax=Nakamurella sp. TaxID=1869182 RepID=UPI003783C55C
MEDASFGPYELRGLLGRGGMGVVYEAFDREQNRVVALKLLPKALIQDEGFVERFRRESFAAARLSDPHVIPIHRYGDIDGRLYLDMRLVRGRDLGQVIEQDAPLPVSRAVSFIAQAAEALDAAHADNLVHRDVKPSNLLVTRHDFVYLVDFGIAHVFGMSTSGQALTATGATIGTLDYMAPERFTGRGEVDARADVYSLACVLYESLTGQRPYPVDGLPALMHAHLDSPAPRAGAVRPDVPAALDRVIAIGMAKDPAARYPSTGDLARAATQAVHGAAHAPGVGVTLPGVGITHPPTDPRIPSPDAGAGTPAPATLLGPGATPGRGGPPAPPTLLGPGAPARPGGPPPPPTFGAPVTVPAGGGPDGRRPRAAVWLVAAASVIVVAAVAGILVWRLTGGVTTAGGRETAGPVAATEPAAASAPPSGPSPVPAPAPPVSSAPTSAPPGTVVVTSTVQQTVTQAQPFTPAPQPLPEPVRGSGDLGLATPIANVGCTSQYLTFVHSATTPGAYQQEVASMLAAFPGSSYLRTDASCGSLAPNLNGNPIYGVYLGPFGRDDAACAARPTASSYVKVLATGVGPDESAIEC